MRAAEKKSGFIFSALLMVLIFWVLPAVAAEKDVFETQQPIATRGSTSSGKDLQFMGVVEPGERMNIILMPTENVKRLLVQRNDSVKRDDIVAILSSDQLVGSLADLQQKKNTIEQGSQQSELLILEIKIKEKHLIRIEKEMAREKKLAESISGYSSSVFRRLENQRQQLADQLVVLKARYDLSRHSDKVNSELANLIKEQIVEVRSRIEALTIRVPFDGRVKYVAHDSARIAPGGVVCEIWDESFFMVRGSIIQHQFDLIKPGDRVRVSIDFVSDVEVIGVVQSINQSQERRQMEGYASFEVMIKVEDVQGVIQPGMMVSILRNEQDNQAGR